MTYSLHLGSTALNWSILSISMVCLLVVISSSESTEPLYSYFHYTAPWHDHASSLIVSTPIMDKHELKRLKSGKELARLRPNGPHDPVESWNRWSTRAGEWYTNNALQDMDRNWAGRKRMHQDLANGSLWWDEDAEDYINAEIEKSQFPADCRKTHWVAHRSHFAGMCSNLHQMVIPLLIGIERGFTVLDIDREKTDKNPTYFGCDAGDRNLHCFFNLTSCKSENDTYRFEKIYAANITDDVTWEKVLIEEDEVFPPGEVTIVQNTHHSFCTGPFTYGDAFTAGKVKLIHGMRKNGMVGVHDESVCHRNGIESRRTDFTLVSILSAWMLSKTSERVKLIADGIMARYSDETGRPAWTPPVLGIHIRQTDKMGEDLFYKVNNRYRNASDYVDPMRKLEKEYGFEWPSVFLISDSGSALSLVAAEINGNSSDPLSMYNSSSAARKDGKKLIIYDWTSDTHIYEKYGAHARIPRSLKVDLQEHFLATLYIFHKISDYAIVTYSSNVGRYLGEVMAAKHRMANPEMQGPFVLSLDRVWSHD
ncbi:hypothetical protein Mapa_002494 [Marchantia paleacea]|nr:hypothetical protein Mapa_002494 [Marchantia paleacea]